MKKNLHDLSGKLKTYSAMAASVLAANSINGQIMYTDIEPDITFDSYGDFYLMDLNMDGTPEFYLYMATNSDPAAFMFISPIIPYGSVNASTGSSGAYRYPLALEAGDMISDSGDWISAPYQTMASVYYFFAGSYGNWFDVSDGYLGLRTKSGGSTYYGWARLDASADGMTFTLKDMAYNSTADEAICAGDKTGPSDCINEIVAATWVGNMDIGDIGNGLDLGFMFNASIPETGISEYRVIAVKSADAGSFDLAAAEALAADQYVSIAPAGTATYSSTFTAASKDAGGALITNDVAYQLFILNTSDDYPSVLSAASNEITLTIFVGVNEIDALSELSVSPNPAVDFIMVDVSGIQSAFTAELFDITGNFIRNIPVVGDEQLHADVLDLSAGNYFIKISDANSIKVLKFVKQ